MFRFFFSFEAVAIFSQTLLRICVCNTYVLHVYVTQYVHVKPIDMFFFFFFLGGPVIRPREGKEKPFLRRNLVDLHPRKEIYGECKRNQPTKQQQQQQTKNPPHPN